MPSHEHWQMPTGSGLMRCWPHPVCTAALDTQAESRESAVTWQPSGSVESATKRREPLRNAGGCFLCNFVSTRHLIRLLSPCAKLSPTICHRPLDQRMP